jgi:hypothetical protein
MLPQGDFCWVLLIVMLARIVMAGAVSVFLRVLD